MLIYIYIYICVVLDIYIGPETSRGDHFRTTPHPPPSDMHQIRTVRTDNKSSHVEI